jgi:Tol biopolymer transport system component
MNFRTHLLRPPALLFGGLLVPVLLIAGCGGGGGSNSGPTIPSATATPTATPILTVTPGPTFTPGPTATATPRPTATVAPLQIPTFTFASTRDGNPEIYLARNNGTAQTRITNVSGTDSTPNLSPNGRAIVYSSTRDGNAEIYVEAIDGSDPIPRRYTADTGLFPPADTSPSWSPDGGSIVWVSTRGGKSNIWVMDDTGENQRQFTNDTTAAFEPAWDPNGSRIAYFVTRGSNTNLQFIGVNANGTPGAVTTSRVTGTASKSSPSFSPDSSRLIFSQGAAGGSTSSLSIYNIAAGTQTAGPSAGTRNTGPTWSPTGNVIVWSASGGVSSNRQLFASVVGSGQNRQLTTAGENVDPSF